MANIKIFPSNVVDNRIYKVILDAIKYKYIYIGTFTL